MCDAGPGEEEADRLPGWRCGTALEGNIGPLSDTMKCGGVGMGLSRGSRSQKRREQRSEEAPYGFRLG
ncbi:hypothetical protein NDU88_011336 [Pleurodeles waltl]|uniref:Uncharacterized protein n=1 Tax=Pleurodeles waltl TaxID=8319 RepID=A0AAV7S3F1_PLEWA|nr:hypothetical protein NDU88_011336 [Pleurodeles waltl]